MLPVPSNTFLIPLLTETEDCWETENPRCLAPRGVSSPGVIAIGLLAAPRDTDNQMFTWTGSRYTQRLFFPIILSYSGGSLSGFAWEMTVVSVFIANFAL